MDRDLTRLVNDLKNAFETGGKYLFDRSVGSGGQGDCFRLRRIKPQPGERLHIVVKISNAPAVDEIALFLRGQRPSGLQRLNNEDQQNEIASLIMLRGAAHIVQMLNLSDSPIEGASIGGEAKWIYMEWMHNGSLEAFLQKAKESGRSLPNRMLWRIFMCCTSGLIRTTDNHQLPVIRMVIALSWPGVYHPEKTLLEDIPNSFSSIVLHNTDVQSKNMMFGPFQPNTEIEHSLTPVIKMIDMGLVQIVRDISTERAFRNEVDRLVNQIIDAMEEPMNIGRISLENDRPLDPDLTKIVTDPLLPDYERPPKLEDLAAYVAQAIVQRDAEWYRTNMNIVDGSEDDDAIRALTRELILVPSMAQP